MRSLINSYIDWIEFARRASGGPETQQRRFTFLRLRFNVLLSQVNIFSPMSLRSGVSMGRVCACLGST